MVSCVDKLNSVKQKICAAAKSAGRNPSDIKLIAVSKTQTKDRVAELLEAGHTRFGENTWQDAMTKIPFFPPPDTEWHFIGRLQSNKAKAVADHCDWIHSVQSLKLAAKISDAAVRLDRCVNVLFQVNIANDPSKQGVSAEDVLVLAEQVLEADLVGVRVQGLMTIGRKSLSDTGGAQRVFAAMKELQLTCCEQFGNHYFPELSMGMSRDYEAAIREGATMVRLGTAIFGARGN